VTFPIVAIGASAGGLEAVSELLAAVPSKRGLAHVVVQHLDPNHESLLPEILAKKTAMPVMPAHEGWRWPPITSTSSRPMSPNRGDSAIAVILSV
jgi:chemotaxis response regulator CheB